MYCLFRLCLFFCNDTSTACIYTFCLTLALHAVLPIVLLVPGVAAGGCGPVLVQGVLVPACAGPGHDQRDDGEQHDGSDGDGDLHGPPLPNDRSGMRSEEHTSELQSLTRISYAVFCLKKKKSNRRELQKIDSNIL